jgi:CheY-like chemotaxis protein
MTGGDGTTVAEPRRCTSVGAAEECASYISRTSELRAVVSDLGHRHPHSAPARGIPRRAERGELYAQLKRQRNDLQRLELHKQQLVAFLVHDLKNPVVRRLREAPETSDIPVIGLSAAALVSDTKRAKGAGFYRYLTKPVKVDELIAVLDELLSAPGLQRR